MPNRILHESIKYCPKMEQLNWFEEVVYHRLTV
ncbi:MAG TPA: transcriptional regulator, partial [Candidatus Ornithocaccomicrobium faecavium]|nr:transcriptional regulator [Candidatus Ornithocaccomicrobium faecavium]